MPYIGFIRRGRPGLPIHPTEGFEGMTYLDVVFNYGAIPGENNSSIIWPYTTLPLCNRCFIVFIGLLLG